MNLENMEMPQQKIGVIEDDQDLLETIVDYLNIKGYSAWKADSTESFYKEFLNHNETDVFIVDISLKDGSGLEIIEYLRGHYAMQHIIIIISGYSELTHRLNGLKTGADCYMVKPIDMQELIENIKAISRRKYLNLKTPDVMERTNKGHLRRRVSDMQNHVTKFRWQLDSRHWTLTSPNNKKLPLTEREYRLLHILISANGQTVNKSRIVSEIIGKHTYNGNERLDLLIARLRKKTLEITNDVLPIKTAHSVGYAFTAPVTVIA
jgi:DNA-binding response OmpR family regulator